VHFSVLLQVFVLWKANNFLSVKKQEKAEKPVLTEIHKRGLNRLWLFGIGLSQRCFN